MSAQEAAVGLRPRLARLRLLRLPLQLAVSVGLLVVLWHVSGGRALARRLSGCDPAWAAAALPFATASLVAGALRWRYTARRLGQRLGVRRAVREFYLACFLSQVLPGGVSGDVVRVWRQSRRALRRASQGGEAAPDSELTEVVPTSQPAEVGRAGVGSALRAVVIERVANQFIMTICVLGSMALWPWVPGSFSALRVWAPLGGALVLTGVVLAVLALFARRGQGTGGGLERFFVDVRRALWSRKGLPAQLGLGLLVMANCLAMFYCAARAVNAPLSVFHLLALVPPALFAMSIPISIGGWGLREASAVALWAMAGLPEGEAMASSVLYGALTLLSTLPGALVLATEP